MPSSRSKWGGGTGTRKVDPMTWLGWRMPVPAWVRGHGTYPRTGARSRHGAANQRKTSTRTLGMQDNNGRNSLNVASSWRLRPRFWEAVTMANTQLSRNPVQHMGVHADVTMSKAQEVKLTEELKYFSVISSFAKSF